MSLKLNERYPGRFNNPTNEYPQGSFKNRTTPDAKDGSYLEKDWANDKEGFFQSLLSEAGITANGLVDAVGASQFYDALIAVIESNTAIPQATETMIGGGKVATQLLVDAGADDASFVTPKKLRARQQTSKTDATVGKLMINGAYGLGDSLFVSNLDTALSGFFYALGSATGSPSPGSAVLHGITLGTSGSSTKTQLCTEVNSGTMYVRGHNGTAWLPWKNLSQSAATEVVAGIAKIATQSLTNAGVDDSTMVSPKKLEAARPKKSQCNAWVNFNGTGAVAIRDSYNVASITDNGVGLYTATFTTNMSNANYATTITTSTSGSTAPTAGVNNQSVSGISMRTAGGGGTAADFDQVCLSVTGGV